MQKSLLDLIINQFEKSKKWTNELVGNSSYRINEKDYKELGRDTLIAQAQSLEEQKLLTVVWVKGYRHYDVEKLSYPLQNIKEFCKLANREYLCDILFMEMTAAKHFYEKTSKLWIKNYIEKEIISRIENGKTDENPEKSKLQRKCLEQLDLLDAPVFKRVFSNHCLGNSKIFEKKLQTFIVNAAKKYNDEIDDAMEVPDVLSQLYIAEYSQELSIKGSLRISVENKIIDTKDFIYGTVLNTQMLKNAVILDNPQIRKIITIENKANFVVEPYESGTLIIYTHGFFSPTEKIFLRKLHEKIKLQPVVYLHSSDMDYGGVRIFKYIRTNIFPELVPYRMDVQTFEKYKNYSEPITENCFDKIQKCVEPLLQDLVNYITKNKIVLEQESYL